MTQSEPAQPRHTADLRQQYATAIRDAVRLRFGPNALRLAEEGRPVMMNASEAETAADAVLATRDAEMGRLRVRAEIAEAELAENTSILQALRRQRDTAEAERDAARTALAEVRKLHQPTEGLGWEPDQPDKRYGHVAQACTSCGTSDEFAVRWPCPTVQIIDRHQPQEQP